MTSTVEMLLLAQSYARPPDSSYTGLAAITAGNATGTQDLTVTWTIPAMDAQPGTWYEVASRGTGVFETATLQLGVSLNGAAPVSTVTLGAAFWAAGTQFSWFLKASAQVTTTGAAGTMIVAIEGGVCIQGANVSSGSNNNNAAIAGNPSSQAVSTLAANTLALTAAWGAAATGQTMTGFGSVYSRKGR